MDPTSLLVLILLILAAGCFGLSAFGVAVTRPALTPLGLLLATLAAVISLWP